jgi:uncharacterized protein (TIGR02266 family)
MSDQPEPLSERRRRERAQVVLVVEYEGAADLLRDYTENLSAGGTLVRTERDFEIGTTIRLVLSFPGLIEPIRLSGVVRWSSAAEGGQRQVGLEFVDFDEGARLRLEQVVRAIGRGDPIYVGRVLRVLVVEDNPHVAGLIRDGLVATSARRKDRVAFEIQTCDNGREALNLIASEDFDAIITDIYLPVLDGIHVIEQIRNDERTRRTPVIAVSAGGPAARERAQSAGADFFLDKPMRLRQILDTMMTLIQARIGSQQPNS